MNTVNAHLEAAARHYEQQGEELANESQARSYCQQQADEVRQMMRNNERLVRDLRTIVNSSTDLDQHERGTLCEAIRALGGNP